MNNLKEYNKIKSYIAKITIAKIFGYTVLTLGIIYLLFDGLYNDTIAETVSYIDRDLYLFFVGTKNFWIIFVSIIVFVLVMFIVIKNAMNNLTIIIDAMDKISKNPEEAIKLPINLLIIEGKLNDIREEIVKAKNKAKEEEKKKNDLIMYMAHDLKTPLTSVIGYLTLLKDEKEISKKMREKYIDIALNKALRVEELTNEFFDITRFNLQNIEINKREIDIVLLLNQLVEESYPMLEEKKLKIEIKSPNSIKYNGDGDKLSRAFGNLIKNAINYSYENTIIHIEVAEENEKIKIEFSNEGDKIPDYKLKRIFEKFYRVDKSRTSKTGNSGLGLAITKEIIKLHGGDITVTNEDKYIKFCIELNK